MLQSIEVLQLPSGELEAWLSKAAEDNEALSVEGPVIGPDAPGRRGTREDSDRHDQLLRNQPAPEAGLVGRLEEQLALLELEQETLAWARFLVSCLDSGGYLSLDDATLLALAEADGLPADPERLESALAVLRGLEPRGIGARNAIEALVLQLDLGDPDYDLLRMLLEDFLEEVARNKLPGVARAMGVSLPELQHLIERLRELDPRPAARLVDEGAPVLHPDVVVEPDGEGFEVRLATGSLPTVRVDGRIASLAADRSQPADVRRYLRKKLDRARWVCEAVEQRGTTLLRIARHTFDHQRAFLEHGPGHLLPLRMNQVAEDLGVHVSTVSRAVSGKYAQTPFGILPLRHFFQASAGADRDSARDDVREAVREIFASEDRSDPLSDDEVVRRLGARGWKLARRTVAKYRKELGIPSSYRRRKFD
jgi:RNA polymerase sigma-54 factor